MMLLGQADYKHDDKCDSEFVLAADPQRSYGVVSDS
jgi:hypothetical protein